MGFICTVLYNGSQRSDAILVESAMNTLVSNCVVQQSALWCITEINVKKIVYTHVNGE